ncbi:MAG: nucleoside hydrolase [Verrucomicrobiales bacterium]|nr:nucleoside hydrolase [Verrucomicrobiales bacterium]
MRTGLNYTFVPPTSSRRVLLLAVLYSVSTALGNPVPVIFDTDMANDCDDAGALAVLNALADKGEAKILAVVTNRKCPGDASAAAADAINTWYGRPDIPIGTDKDGAKVGGKPSSYTSSLRDEFPHDAKPDHQMPDALDVYRNALSAEADGSVVICSVGALSNLEDLLRTEEDRQLIKTKVKTLYVMGGGFPRTNRPETNIKLDPAAAVSVTNLWPTPIVWQGYEVGAAMSNGAELQESPKENPVRRAYELRPFYEFSAIDYGKPNHDLATVLLAVRGIQPEYWQEYKGGRVVIDSEGATYWETSWARKHRYVKIKGHPQKLEKLLGDLLAAPPKK